MESRALKEDVEPDEESEPGRITSGRTSLLSIKGTKDWYCWTSETTEKRVEGGMQGSFLSIWEE